MAPPLDRTHYQSLTRDEAQATVDLLSPWVSPGRRERIEQVLSARTRDVVLVLEEVYTDHNRAAVLRTADAFGLMEVHHVSQELERRFSLSKRVALGSEKWMDLRRHPSLMSAVEGLKARGYRVYAAAVHGDSPPVDALPDHGPLALMFGNELRGLSDEAVAAADGCFRIPMWGFAESFNISVAAAITLNEVMKRRRAMGQARPPTADDALRLRACWLARSVRAAPQLLAQRGLPLPTMSSVELEWTE